MYTPMNPRDGDYRCDPVTILKQPRYLEHFVVSIWCATELREPLHVCMVFLRDVAGKEVR